MPRVLALPPNLLLAQPLDAADAIGLLFSRHVMLAISLLYSDVDDEFPFDFSTRSATLRHFSMLIDYSLLLDVPDAEPMPSLSFTRHRYHYLIRRNLSIQQRCLRHGAAIVPR